jgi:hypothetical protein
MMPSDLLVNVVMAQRRRQADQERLARATLAWHRGRGTEPRIRLLIDWLKPVRTNARRAVRSGQA